MRTSRTTAFATAFSLVLALCAAPATARDKILVPAVPAYADRQQVVAIIRQAFEGREWTVIASDADSVTATLEHREYRARMRVAVVGAQLIYEETATRAQTGHPADPDHGRHFPAHTPSKWIHNLAVDISRQLVLLPKS